jgi:glutathione S-transferase
MTFCFCKVKIVKKLITPIAKALTMKLYGSYTSPFVRHCRIVLLETKLECSFVETDQTGSALKSPTQRVPFLEDGNIFLTDSSTIIRHLREKAGSTFCESIRELNDFCMINAALDASVNLFFLERDGIKISEIPYLQRQAVRIESSLDELNKNSLPNRAPYNDAQLRLGCYIDWAKFRNRIDFSKYQYLEVFHQGMQAYDHFNATKPKA